MSLESRLKSAVNALEKPFKGIIPENLMPEHSKWVPDESSEDDPTPSPEPELPDQDPLPSSAMASTAGGYYVEGGMIGATVTFSQNGNTLSTGLISQGKPDPFYADAASPMAEVGSSVDVLVTMEGYKDWSTTVTVQGGK